jgi:hypothetical protein
MKRFTASLLCVLLLASGCVTSRTPRVQATPQGSARITDGDVLAGFAGELRLGSRVKATTTGNRIIRGTLVKRTDQALVLQPRTRVAEPLVEIPFGELLALEQENPSSGTGRAVAIGVGVGVSAAVVTLYVLALLLGGS